jgi:hypothetical protein
MTDRPSPRDRLRKANPIDPQAMPSSDAPEAHALLERIVRSDGDSLVVRPRRRRRWLLILVPIAIGAAIAAGYGIFRDVRQPLIVACYPRASLDAGPSVVSVGTGTPLEACAFLWEPGGAFHGKTGESMPTLTACVLETGTVGVFPSRTSEDVCAELGLAHPRETAPAGEQGAAASMAEAISQRFENNRCFTESEARAFVVEEFERFGLDDWQVVVTIPFDEARPCASVAIDYNRRVVELVPIPRA